MNLSAKNTMFSLLAFIFVDYLFCSEADQVELTELVESLRLSLQERQQESDFNHQNVA